MKGESEDTAEPTACLYVKKKAVPYAGFNSLSQVITIRLKDNLEPKLQSVNTWWHIDDRILCTKRTQHIKSATTHMSTPTEWNMMLPS